VEKNVGACAGSKAVGMAAWANQVAHHINNWQPSTELSLHLECAAAVFADRFKLVVAISN
jgi:hypothetical protein